MIVFAFSVFDDLLEAGVHFGPHLDSVVRAATEKIASNRNLEIGTRECGMDFLEILVEAETKLLVANQGTV